MPQEIDDLRNTMICHADHNMRELAFLDQIDFLQCAVRAQGADMQSLERLYARTLDHNVQLERTLTTVREECNRLLEECRALRASDTTDNTPRIARSNGRGDQ